MRKEKPMNLTELAPTELHEVRGGDWFETTWGIMLGSAFVAGFLGSGGFLALAGAAGVVLVLDGYAY
jgi:hypothetical protein